MTTPVTGLWFPNLMTENDIVWSSARLKVGLVTSTWDPDTDLPLGWNDDTGNTAGHDPLSHEASGAGYPTGGIALSNVVKSVAGGKFVVTCDTIVFSGVAVSNVKHAVVYDDAAVSPIGKPIVVVHTYPDTLSNSGGDFTIPLADTPVANCLAALRNPGVT